MTAEEVRSRVKEIFDSLPKYDIDEERHNRVEFSLNALEAFALLFYQAGAEWMARQGCTVEIDEGYFINNPQHDRREGKFHKYYSSTFGHSKKIVVTPGDKVRIQITKVE